MKDIQRVKYFSDQDSSISYFIDRAITVLEQLYQCNNLNDINDAIEVYESKRVLDTDIGQNIIKDKGIDIEINEHAINSTLGKFFSNINNHNVEALLQTVDLEYHDSFWELAAFFKVYKRIDEKTISRIISENADFYSILHIKVLTHYYGSCVRDAIVSNCNHAEILIREYLENKEYQYKHYFFPNELTLRDKVNLIEEYLDSDKPNLNYVKLLSYSSGNDLLPIEDRLKLKARRKYEDLAKSLFDGNSMHRYGANIIFKPLSYEGEVNYYLKDDIATIEYDTNWIDNNLDYPTLLNNFIYYFNYTDSLFRISLLSHSNMLGVFERFLGIHSNREYRTGVAFDTLQMTALSSMRLYCLYLAKFNIRVEDLIEWFFQKYLPDEFGVKGFVFNKPQEENSTLGKCRDLAIEIESVLKQFNLYCKYGEIDRELFEISTNHMFIKDIESIIPNKYVYPIGTEISFANNLLFSTQSMLLMPNDVGEYECAYDILKEKKINYLELNKSQKCNVDWLCERGILEISDNYITYDPHLLSLLYDLNKNGFSCSRYLKEYDKQVQNLNNKGWIEFSSSLLSKQEQDYYNYIFNNSEFDNSLDLRNKYAHGNQSLDINVLEKDYYTYLIMFVIIVIKINEEFCLKEKNNNESFEE